MGNPHDSDFELTKRERLAARDCRTTLGREALRFSDKTGGPRPDHLCACLQRQGSYVHGMIEVAVSNKDPADRSPRFTTAMIRRNKSSPSVVGPVALKGGRLT